jgi:hypothetical protein
MSGRQYEREVQIVGMYIESAKSYSQLSTGALALLALFGPTQLPNLSRGLLAAGMCFLTAALAGGAYQALAVKRLERQSKLPVARDNAVIESASDNSYVFYRILVFAFHIGAVTLAIVAILRFL